MRRIASLIVSGLLVACSDAAFNTASPGDDAGADASGIDSTIATDGATDSTAPTDGPLDGITPGDATVDGTPVVDAGGPDARDYCRGPAGITIPTDRLVVDPDPVKLGSSFTVYVVSQKTLPNLTINIGGSYCAGGSGFTAIEAGPDCKEFFAAKVTVTTSPSAKPIDKVGVYNLEVFVDDPDAPCTAPFNRKITGTVTVN